MPDPIVPAPTNEAASGSPTAPAPDAGTPPADGPVKPLSEMSAEEVFALIEKKPDGPKLVNDLKATWSSRAIESWKTNNLAKTIEAEIARRFPPATESEKKLAELTERLGQIENENKLKDVKVALLTGMNDRGIPAEFAEFFRLETVEQVGEQLGTFAKTFKAAVDQAVEQRIKGATAPRGPAAAGPAEGLTLEAFRKLTPEQQQEALRDGKVSHLLAPSK